MVLKLVLRRWQSTLQLGLTNEMARKSKRIIPPAESTGKLKLGPQSGGEFRSKETEIFILLHPKLSLHNEMPKR